MNLQSRNKLSVDFSMSSMTDIVFLLLIFFVLTSTLVSPNALKLILPKSTVQVPNSTPFLSVYIDQDINYYIENEKNKVDLSNLKAIIHSKLSGNTNKEIPTIKLYAEKSVPVEYIVNIMTIAKEENFRLILATDPK